MTDLTREPWATTLKGWRRDLPEVLHGTAALRSMGVLHRPPSHPRPQDVAIRALRDQGIKREAIAAEFGVSVCCVERALGRYDPAYHSQAGGEG